MKVEAVTICCGYSDFLAETAKHNAHLLDRWVIVTTPDDKGTIELCRRRNLQCVVTDEFSRGGQRPFNKGRGISLGMNYLSEDAWVLLMDADIVLPRAFRQMLDVAHLQKDTLYGCDRIDLFSWDEWKRVEASGYLTDQHGYHLCCNFPQPARVGTRVIRGRHGYVPIGFFALHHYTDGVHSGFRYKDYPDCNDDCAHSDIKYAIQWPRAKRQLLPEVVVLHLQSEPAELGANWKGRKTKPFGPAVPPPAAKPTTPS